MKYIFITFFLFGLSEECLSQVKKDSLRVLFVGNSYTYYSNMPHLASLISDSTSIKLITSQSAIGSATLKDHWHSKKGLKTKKRIKEGNYDIVVIQEHSMGTIENKDDFLNYTKKLCDLVKDSGAKPYLYVTWAREKVPQYQDTITKVYKEAAQLNDCNIIFVGEAWKIAKTLRPDIELYEADGSHQSDLGAFLTACVVVNSLANDLPERLPNLFFMNNYKREQIMLLREDPLDITFCIKVASDFAED